MGYMCCRIQPIINSNNNKKFITRLFHANMIKTRYNALNVKKGNKSSNVHSNLSYKVN